MFPMTITIQNHEQLAAVLAALGASLPTPQAQQPQRVEAPAQPAQEQKQEPAAAQQQAPAATYDETSRWLTKVYRAKGRDEAKRIIAAHGGTILQEVDESHYPAIIDECKQILSKA